MGFAVLVNDSDTPHLVRWIRQINERPAAKDMFAHVPRERFGPACED
jgi:glutathione S-transferase